MLLMDTEFFISINLFIENHFSQSKMRPVIATFGRISVVILVVLNIRSCGKRAFILLVLTSLLR